MSLWSTLEGRPVIGKLAGQDLELEFRPVVTTTWKEWRTLHPDTVVLSIDTGVERDYSEGAAYRDYFRNDRLMFGVPKLDKRLKNKDEVLTLLLRPKGAAPDAERKALALSARFLNIHHVSFAGHDLVVVTSKKGANRVYDASQRRCCMNIGKSLILLTLRFWPQKRNLLIPLGLSGVMQQRRLAPRIRSPHTIPWIYKLP